MRKSLFASICFACLLCFGQNDISGRIILFPTGTITTLQYTFGSESNWTWIAEFGYNATAKLKSNEFIYTYEYGKGLGFGTGMRKYFGDQNSRFYAELIGQLWFMKIKSYTTFICGLCEDPLPPKHTNLLSFNRWLGQAMN